MLEDALAAPTRKPFSYSWLLILIALVPWMEPKDYQPMTVDLEKVCRGAWYKKLWWFEEPSRQADYAIHSWVYSEALQAVAIVVSQVSPYATTKYQRLIWFTIRPHSIYI